jgi:hypothetical protein
MIEQQYEEPCTLTLVVGAGVGRAYVMVRDVMGSVVHKTSTIWL